ncbi:MAG: pyruvate:ferredoxin (flavodoxin) oxidoreductase [Pirellulales bacterium]
MSGSESSQSYVTWDGNDAASDIAYRTSEVIAIYPITPASPMGEKADAWAAAGRVNLDGIVPRVIEMQSEGGAAGSVHGALQAGAMTTTFTASQGLLLMIPNMYKIAGELTPTVFHVAARTLATHALSIFGDHSDVMSVRGTGWAMLCASSVQEAHDFALIAQVATLKSRVPFLHFFDGFRTSHEVNKISPLPDDVLRAMIPRDAIEAHRRRALDPDHPVLRGTAQNPDVFFQAREGCNPYYLATPGIVQEAMDDFAKLVGRRYRAFEYLGDPDADRVLVLMGSGVGAAREAIDQLRRQGEKVGMVVVRLYRPFAADWLLEALPKSVKSIAVLDRTKEPGAPGEPLFQDVASAIYSHWDVSKRGPLPLVTRGRYGLSSKEFTPSMVAGIYADLASKAPHREFTVGIVDDVTHLSLSWDADAVPEANDVTRAVFYGLGSDGTVGATKNTTKIIGENTPLYVQGYFVYDSKKSGATTVSHLRFSPRPIESTYLIQRANFVACHQFQFLDRMEMLELAAPKATFLLNTPYDADDVWNRLPGRVQQQILDKQLRLFVINADVVAREAGMGNRINTIMQTCFFALSGVLPRDEAIDHIKHAIEKTYAKRGESVVAKNFAAVDATLASLHELDTAKLRVTNPIEPAGVDWDRAPDFVRRVTAVIASGKGDLLPVSAFPVDGTFPTSTACFEKRSIAHEIPIWDPSICIDCGLCSFVCPHAAIRMKLFDANGKNGQPAGFRQKAWTSKEFAGKQLVIQVAPDDCTGCGVCVDVCPARSKEVARHKAINMEPKLEHLEVERANFDYFLQIPDMPREQVNPDVVKSTQLLQPLFEYSGACAGCGETPYLKLMSQLFGDRAVIANATGCSSIYGGNLPTTPWSQNRDGRGPAWANSLFEDNAEFGLGMRLAIDQKRVLATSLLQQLASQVGDSLAAEVIEATCEDEAGLQQQRARIELLRRRLAGIPGIAAAELSQMADSLVPRSVWIVGGDGWAYDIGFGGLDHVLAVGENVNVLVLDTGVYSNTGGQASKATPRAAAAKFAADGKSSRKKDLGMLAVSYGHIYVAQIAMGANPQQTIRAFREAESYDGPSLLIAYSQCIAHGIDMTTGMTHQKDAVKSGFWPLYRYDPRLARGAGHPFQLDSRKPSIPLKDFALKEARFAMLARSDAEQAQRLLQLAQADIDDQWHYYEQMGAVERDMGEVGAEV